MATLNPALKSTYVNQTLANASKRQLRRVQDALGLYYVNLVKDNTRKGLDPQGGKLAKYSPEYLAFKKKKGKGSTVNMRFTNKMINNYRYFPTKSSVLVRGNTVQFSIVLGYGQRKQAQKAEWQRTGAGNLPVRPFDVINTRNPKVQKGAEKVIEKFS